MKKLFNILLFVLLSIYTQAQKDTNIDFKIQRGDNISILVMDHPEFTVEKIKVLPDGCIQFPVLGNVYVDGMSSVTLADSIKNSLKKYVVEPIVTVFINEIEHSSVNIFGYFNRPGKYTIYKPTNLFTAFSLAGGVKNIRKMRKITIIRANGNIEEIKVKGRKKKKLSQLNDIEPLLPGDTLIIKDPMKVEWGLLSLLVTLAHLIIVIV